MKRLFILLLITQHLLCFSQGNTTNVKRIFKASITQIKGRITTGYLAAVDDSTITLADQAPHDGLYSREGTNLLKFNYSTIEKVIIRRKGSTGRGFLYGAIIGLGSGAVLGMLGTKGPMVISTGQKAIIGGMLGAIGGTIIGGVIGLRVTKTFAISSRRKKFDKMRISITDRMYGSKQ